MDGQRYMAGKRNTTSAESVFLSIGIEGEMDENISGISSGGAVMAGDWSCPLCLSSDYVTTSINSVSAALYAVSGQSVQPSIY